MNSTPTFQLVAADVAVAPQLDPAAMAWAAQNGFKSVINNRPDFEGGPSQPTSAALEAAAREAGLAYAFLPVSPAMPAPQDVERMAQLLAELPRPILAFCRSGTRSGNLYRAAANR